MCRRPIDPGMLANKQTQPVSAFFKPNLGTVTAMSGVFINSPLHDSYRDILLENVVTADLPLTHAKYPSRFDGLSADCTWPYIRQIVN
jgi:hypothetical protein